MFYGGPNGKYACDNLFAILFVSKCHVFSCKNLIRQLFYIEVRIHAVVVMIRCIYDSMYSRVV